MHCKYFSLTPPPLYDQSEPEEGAPSLELEEKNVQSGSMDSNTGEISVDSEDTVDHSEPMVRIKCEIYRTFIFVFCLISIAWYFLMGMQGFE